MEAYDDKKVNLNIFDLNQLKKTQEKYTVFKEKKNSNSLPVKSNNSDTNQKKDQTIMKNQQENVPTNVDNKEPEMDNKLAGSGLLSNIKKLANKIANNASLTSETNKPLPDFAETTIKDPEMDDDPTLWWDKEKLDEDRTASTITLPSFLLDDADKNLDYAMQKVLTEQQLAHDRIINEGPPDDLLESKQAILESYDILRKTNNIPLMDKLHETETDLDLALEMQDVAPEETPQNFSDKLSKQSLIGLLTLYEVLDNEVNRINECVDTIYVCYRANKIEVANKIISDTYYSLKNEELSAAILAENHKELIKIGTFTMLNQLQAWSKKVFFYYMPKVLKVINNLNQASLERTSLKRNISNNIRKIQGGRINNFLSQDSSTNISKSTIYSNFQKIKNSLPNMRKNVITVPSSPQEMITKIAQNPAKKLPFDTTSLFSNSVLMPNSIPMTNFTQVGKHGDMKNPTLDDGTYPSTEKQSIKIEKMDTEDIPAQNINPTDLLHAKLKASTTDVSTYAFLDSLAKMSQSDPSINPIANKIFSAYGGGVDSNPSTPQNPLSLLQAATKVSSAFSNSSLIMPPIINYYNALNNNLGILGINTAMINNTKLSKIVPDQITYGKALYNQMVSSMSKSFMLNDILSLKPFVNENYSSEQRDYAHAITSQTTYSDGFYSLSGQEYYKSVAYLNTSPNPSTASLKALEFLTGIMFKPTKPFDIKTQTQNEIYNIQKTNEADVNNILKTLTNSSYNLTEIKPIISPNDRTFNINSVLEPINLDPNSKGASNPKSFAPTLYPNYRVDDIPQVNYSDDIFADDQSSYGSMPPLTDDEEEGFFSPNGGDSFLSPYDTETENEDSVFEGSLVMGTSSEGSGMKRGRGVKKTATKQKLQTRQLPVVPKMPKLSENIKINTFVKIIMDTYNKLAIREMYFTNNDKSVFSLMLNTAYVANIIKMRTMLSPIIITRQDVTYLRAAAYICSSSVPYNTLSLIINQRFILNTNLKKADKKIIKYHKDKVLGISSKIRQLNETIKKLQDALKEKELRRPYPPYIPPGGNDDPNQPPPPDFRERLQGDDYYDDMRPPPQDPPRGPPPGGPPGPRGPPPGPPGPRGPPRPPGGKPKGPPGDKPPGPPKPPGDKPKGPDQNVPNMDDSDLDAEDLLPDGEEAAAKDNELNSYQQIVPGLSIPNLNQIGNQLGSLLNDINEAQINNSLYPNLNEVTKKNTNVPDNELTNVAPFLPTPIPKKAEIKELPKVIRETYTDLPPFNIHQNDLAVARRRTEPPPQLENITITNPPNILTRPKPQKREVGRLPIRIEQPNFREQTENLPAFNIPQNELAVARRRTQPTPELDDNEDITITNPPNIYFRQPNAPPNDNMEVDSELATTQISNMLASMMEPLRIDDHYNLEAGLMNIVGPSANLNRPNVNLPQIQQSVSNILNTDMSTSELVTLNQITQRDLIRNEMQNNLVNSINQLSFEVQNQNLSNELQAVAQIVQEVNANRNNEYMLPQQQYQGALTRARARQLGQQLERFVDDPEQIIRQQRRLERLARQDRARQQNIAANLYNEEANAQVLLGNPSLPNQPGRFVDAANAATEISNVAQTSRLEDAILVGNTNDAQYFVDQIESNSNNNPLNNINVQLNPQIENDSTPMPGSQIQELPTADNNIEIIKQEDAKTDETPFEDKIDTIIEIVHNKPKQEKTDKVYVQSHTDHTVSIIVNQDEVDQLEAFMIPFYRPPSDASYDEEGNLKPEYSSQFPPMIQDEPEQQSTITNEDTTISTINRAENFIKYDPAYSYNTDIIKFMEQADAHRSNRYFDIGTLMRLSNARRLNPDDMMRLERELRREFERTIAERNTKLDAIRNRLIEAAIARQRDAALRARNAREMNLLAENYQRRLRELQQRKRKPQQAIDEPERPPQPASEQLAIEAPPSSTETAPPSSTETATSTISNIEEPSDPIRGPELRELLEDEYFTELMRNISNNVLILARRQVSWPTSSTTIDYTSRLEYDIAQRLARDRELRMRRLPLEYFMPADDPTVQERAIEPLIYENQSNRPGLRPVPYRIYRTKNLQTRLLSILSTPPSQVKKRKGQGIACSKCQNKNYTDLNDVDEKEVLCNKCIKKGMYKNRTLIGSGAIITPVRKHKKYGGMIQEEEREKTMMQKKIPTRWENYTNNQDNSNLNKDLTNNYLMFGNADDDMLDTLTYAIGLATHNYDYMSEIPPMLLANIYAGLSKFASNKKSGKGIDVNQLDSKQSTKQYIKDNAFDLLSSITQK